MKIVFPKMHRRVAKSLAKALEPYNHQILIPDHTFSNVISYGDKMSQEEIDNDPFCSGCTNIKSISLEELYSNPPDVFIVSCYEVERDILTNIWPKLKNTKTKLVYYNGNNDFYCNWDYAQNIITADIVTAKKAQLRNKNMVFWLPWVDFHDEFKFKGINNNNVLNSYITNYQKLFPQDYNKSLEIKNYIEKQGFKFNIYDSAGFNNVSDLLRDSCGTIHIKSLEGYGYSIIESIASGRMVFLYRPYSTNRTYTNWCIEDKTCFYFDDNEELLIKLRMYHANLDKYQVQCSENIRQLINNEKQGLRLNKYLEDIVNG